MIILNFKEFDNIPTVIPRFLFHLNHQLKAVCDYLKERDEEERTKTLRDYFANKLQQSDQRFTDFIEGDIKAMKDQNTENSKNINKLFQKSEALHTEITELGALDFKKMLSGVGLGFSSSPKKTSKNQMQNSIGRVLSVPKTAPTSKNSLIILKTSKTLYT